MPFSLRTVPKTIDRHTVVNNFSPLCFTLRIHEEFDQAMLQIKRQTSSMKNSLYPHGNYSLSQFVAMMPPLIAQVIGMWLVSKATVVFSNIPGPIRPYSFG